MASLSLSNSQNLVSATSVSSSNVIRTSGPLFWTLISGKSCFEVGWYALHIKFYFKLVCLGHIQPCQIIYTGVLHSTSWHDKLYKGNSWYYFLSISVVSFRVWQAICVTHGLYGHHWVSPKILYILEQQLTWVLHKDHQTLETAHRKKNSYSLKTWSFSASDLLQLDSVSKYWSLLSACT